MTYLDANLIRLYAPATPPDIAFSLIGITIAQLSTQHFITKLAKFTKLTKTS